MKIFTSFLLFCALILPGSGIFAQDAASSGSQLAERAFSRGQPVPAWVRPAGELPPAAADGPLSMRLGDTQIHLDTQSSAVYTHRAYTVHEASSLGALGQLEIDFQPEYQQVHLHLLRIVRDGKIIDKLGSADIRFLQRERELDNGVYSGTVTAAIVNPDVRVGDTLEMAYTIWGDNPVFANKFFHSTSWDTSVPVSLRRVILDAPENRIVHYRFIGPQGGVRPSQVERHADGRRVLTLEARSLPAVLGESDVPRDVQPYRWLQLSEFASWQEVNAWALGLFSYQPDPGIGAVLKQARAVAGEEEAVATVLDFVQNDIRYLSIALGQNSHRPFPPQQVLARRYGDCKDKSLLMVAMLRELGIAADPVLVSTTLRKGLDQMLPSPALFDHAIVRVRLKGREYYFDPTRQGQYGALARMGQVHAGNQVLPVAVDSMGLTVVPMPDAAGAGRYLRTERITVEAMDRPPSMQVTTSLEGVEAEYARVNLLRMSKEQLRKVYEGLLVKRYPDAELLGDPVVNDDRQRNLLRVESRYRIGKLFTPNAEGWGMNYVPSNLVDLVPTPGSAKRALPFALPAFPMDAAYELELVLPAAFAMPESEFKSPINSPAFSAERAVAVGARTLSARFTLHMAADRVPPGEIQAYLADAQKFHDMLNGGLRVFKEHMNVAAVAPPSVEAKLNEALAGINRGLADAELAGADTSAALCERALVRAYLGRPGDALKDANQAVQRQPQAADMLRCRADVLLLAGKFKEGESDYAKAIARGSDEAAAFIGKGMAALYQDKAAVARAEFARAMAKAGDGEERQRAAIWHAIAQVQEQGGAMPGAASDSEPGGTSWLTAAQELFAGRGTPERMLSAAGRGASGRLLEARLTEAYFYAGKFYALKHDGLRARVYFQNALDKKVLNSTYNGAAHHELARLAKP